MSVPTLSHLERRDMMGQIFRRISLITLVPFDLERPFYRITHVGKGVFLGVSDTPTARGLAVGALLLPNFGGSLLFMHTTLTQNYQI